MNVTIKISEQLGREARHRAVDAGESLSGWVARLIQKELAKGKAGRCGSLLELLGDERSAGADVEFPRSKSGARSVDFS